MPRAATDRSNTPAISRPSIIARLRVNFASCSRCQCLTSSPVFFLYVSSACRKNLQLHARPIDHLGFIQQHPVFFIAALQIRILDENLGEALGMRIDQI